MSCNTASVGDTTYEPIIFPTIKKVVTHTNPHNDCVKFNPFSSCTSSGSVECYRYDQYWKSPTTGAWVFSSNLSFDTKSC